MCVCVCVFVCTWGCQPLLHVQVDGKVNLHIWKNLDSLEIYGFSAEVAFLWRYRLFCGNIGSVAKRWYLIWYTYIYIWCIYIYDIYGGGNRYYKSKSIRKTKSPHFGDTELFCQDILLFCGGVVLICREMGLFCWLPQIHVDQQETISTFQRHQTFCGNFAEI